MVRLYDRDARDLASLLDLVAAFCDARLHDVAGQGKVQVGQIAMWRPTEIAQTHNSQLVEQYGGALTAARIKSIRAAILEQLISADQAETVTPQSVGTAEQLS